MPLDSERAFIVFQVGGKLGALPLEGVERITAMAELAQPPGLPAPLAGILNLAGNPVPVLRLDHLLQLPEGKPGLYSMLVLAKGGAKKQTRKSPVAILVDRVSEILHVSGDDLLPVRKEDSFNACVQATIKHGQKLIHVLAPERILLEKELEVLAIYVDRERSRLANWGKSIQ